MSGLNADEEFIPYCYEAVPLRAPNMDGSSSAYAAALKERLGKVRAEVELQAQLAHRLKNDLNEVEDQAQRNQEELALRRQSWAKEQPSREALLHETGEAERSLAARERSCAQALARHVQAEVTRAARKSHGPNPGERSEASWELETLEAKRQELSKGLQELTAAVRQESQLISQLTSKGEALRRETRALRTGTEAAKESEARVWRNMEDLKAAEHAMFQREQLLQRQALDLRELAKRLRAQLEVRPVNGMNEVADQLNRKLEAKVEFLRKELEQEKAKHAAHAAEPFSRSPGGATPGSSHLVGSAGVAGRE